MRKFVWRHSHVFARSHTVIDVIDDAIAVKRWIIGEPKATEMQVSRNIIVQYRSIFGWYNNYLLALFTLNYYIGDIQLLDVQH